MLPETLSNDLCSLNPHQDKNVFSVIVEFDKQHKIKNTKFVKSTINSNERMSYEEVQYILNQNKTSSLEAIFKRIKSEGKGALIFINQLQPADLLLEHIKAIQNPTKKKRNMDEKDFGIGAQMLHAVGISKIKLLSNSEQIKRVGMSGYGLEIVSYETY